MLSIDLTLAVPTTLFAEPPLNVTVVLFTVALPIALLPLDTAFI